MPTKTRDLIRFLDTQTDPENPKITGRISVDASRDGRMMPHDLAEVVWQMVPKDDDGHRDLRCTGMFAPPTLPAVENLILQAYFASMRCEEGRPVRFQGMYCNQTPTNLTVPFNKPIEYSSANLVRLAPTIGLGVRRLIVCPDPDHYNEGKQRIAGIHDLHLAASAPGEGPVAQGDAVCNAGWQFAVLDPGRVRISPDLVTFELRDGTVDVTTELYNIAPVGSWIDEVSQSLSGAKYGAPGYAAAWTAMLGLWRRTLEKVASARHGGCLLIIPDGENQDQDVLRVKYKTESSVLSELLQANVNTLKSEPFENACLYQMDNTRVEVLRSVGVTIPDRRGLSLDDTARMIESIHTLHRAARDLARGEELLAELSATDGAVVLDRKLRIIGFGAEIRTTGAVDSDEQIPIAVPKDHEGERPSEPLSEFGMRHRSAFRFCKDCVGALAFVISQDGDVSVFWNTGRNKACMSRNPLAKR